MKVIEHKQSVQNVQSVAIKPQTTFKKKYGVDWGYIFHICHLFRFHGNPTVY